MIIGRLNPQPIINLKTLQFKGIFNSPVPHLIEIYRVDRCYEMCQKSFHFHCQICQCNELTDGLRAELYFQWHKFLWNGMFVKQINVLN